MSTSVLLQHNAFTHNQSVDERTVERRHSTPVVEDGHGKQAVWLGNMLPPTKRNNGGKSHNDGSQCSDRVPWVLNTSPIETDEEASHATNEEERAELVSALELLG